MNKKVMLCAVLLLCGSSSLFSRTPCNGSNDFTCQAGANPAICVGSTIPAIRLVGWSCNIPVTIPLDKVFTTSGDNIRLENGAIHVACAGTYHIGLSVQFGFPNEKKNADTSEARIWFQSSLDGKNWTDKIGSFKDPFIHVTGKDSQWLAPQKWEESELQGGEFLRIRAQANNFTLNAVALDSGTIDISTTTVDMYRFPVPLGGDFEPPAPITP